MLAPKEIGQLVRDAIGDFKKHNALKLSASLAFYTLFSLAPMLLIILYVSKIFLESQTVDSDVYSKISAIVGKDATLQIQTLIKNASPNSTDFMAVAGIVALFIAANSSFMEVQSSLNVIWNLKLKSGQFWKQLLKSRLISFGVVAGLSLLLLFSLLLNGILEGFMDKFRETFPYAAMKTIYVLNQGIILLFVATLFSVIYKVLPYATIRWNETVAGAVAGSFLFMVGRFALGFLIAKSGLNGTFGAGGSLIILLVWIFYSAITLYFGAEISKVYALNHGVAIQPKEYAFLIKWVNAESQDESTD